MKKVLFLVLMFMLFIPIYVDAETCDMDKISISSITMEEKSENVFELGAATANGKKINLNLSMSSVGDTIKYKITIKNDSDIDFIIDKNSLNIESDYIDYYIESNDNSNIVKKKSSETMYLNIQYKNKVPSELFESGLYNTNNNMQLQLLTENGAFSTLKNPNTGISLLVLVIPILTIGITIYSLIRKRNNAILLIIIGTASIIPISVYAMCNYEIKIESKISIKKTNYNPCTFDGDMVVGARFTNGNFEYSYAQGNYSSYEGGWEDTNVDGWGVKYRNYGLSDLEYPFCSSINGKPIVYMSSMFSNTDVTNFDFSQLDTSNVISMDGMFNFSITPEHLDLSGFDTSNVENMRYMLGTNNSKTVDLSSINTSNVIDMSGLFFQSHFEELDLSNFNTSHVFNMSNMFSNTYDLVSLDLSSFNTSNVVDMSSMFNGSNVRAVDFSSFDTRNVTRMIAMFHSSKIEELDLSSFELNNVNVSNMFIGATTTIGYAKSQNEANILNASSDKPSTLTFVVR